MNLKRVTVNSQQVDVVRAGAVVADPQRKWEQGTAESYVDSKVQAETDRATAAETAINNRIDEIMAMLNN